MSANRDWVWSQGRILPASELAVPIDDRAFEHGLGAFETFRAWSGDPVLLPRHRRRLTATAQALGLPLDADDLPDAAAVRSLIEANGHGGDAVLRITVSGGAAERPCLVWMKSSPLPPPWRRPLKLAVSPWPRAKTDPLARYKTLNYWERRLAFEYAQREGADDSVILTTDHLFVETTRMNLFAVQGERLLTAADDGRILPGVFRELVLEICGRIGLEVQQIDFGLKRAILERSREAFATNSVRGIAPIGEISGVGEYNAPGPVTTRLIEECRRWIESAISE